jgi:hypothetical protein
MLAINDCAREEEDEPANTIADLQTPALNAKKNELRRELRLVPIMPRGLSMAVAGLFEFRTHVHIDARSGGSTQAMQRIKLHFNGQE